MSDVREMFTDLERVLSSGNVLRRRLRISGVGPDDASQEVRLAVLKSLDGYDFNRADGQLLPYLRMIAANTQNELYAKSRRLCRNPHAVATTDGGRENVLLHQVDYDGVAEYAGDSGGNACDGLIEREMSAELESFLAELTDSLGQRERDVLACRFQPSEALQEIMKELGDESSPSNVAIARHLGLRKNEVDWAWYKIRLRFTELASDEAFSDVFGDDVISQGWPTAHVSKGTRFHEAFVARTLKARNLSSERAGAPLVQQSEVGARMLEEYKWGTVLRAMVDGVYWTAVLEGRFAPRTGELFGACGARILIPVEGYARLARSLPEGDVSSSTRALPICLSDYEQGFDVCDGDASNPPCASRDACVALKLRMRVKNTALSVYVEERADMSGAPYFVAKDSEKFDKIVAGTVKAYDIRDGKAHRAAPPPAPRGHSKAEAPRRAERLAEEAKAASNKSKGVTTTRGLSPAVAASVAAKARRKGAPLEKRRTAESLALDSWATAWLKAIVAGTERTFCKDDELVQPGQLFLRDRRLASGYLGLYCRRPDGKDAPVAYLHYKPRNGRMDLKLPLEPGKIAGVSASTMKVLRPTAHADGAWKSIAAGLDQVGVMLGAEAVVKLVNAGIISLPET